MTNKNSFSLMGEKEITSKQKVITPNKIYKKLNVNVQSPLQIKNISKPQKQTKKIGQEKEQPIIPIIENDEIIGITFNCECGKQTKVFFEYLNE